jgi:pre-mRNA-processing factor SLU7
MLPPSGGKATEADGGEPKTLLQQHLEDVAAGKKRAENASSKPRVGFGIEDEASLDNEKLKKALQKEEQKNRKRRTAGDDEDEGGERKKGYNSLKGENDAAAVTAEELEAYRLKRTRGDDPMAAFL